MDLLSGWPNDTPAGAAVNYVGLWLNKGRVAGVSLCHWLGCFRLPVS